MTSPLFSISPCKPYIFWILSSWLIILSQYYCQYYWHTITAWTTWITKTIWSTWATLTKWPPWPTWAPDHLDHLENLGNLNHSIFLVNPDHLGADHLSKPLVAKSYPERQFANLEKIVRKDNLQDDWSTMTNCKKIVQMDIFQIDTTGKTICKKKNNSQWPFAKASCSDR